MAAVGAVVPGPFALRAAAAFVAYVVVLIGFERAVFTDDTREIWKAIELRALARFALGPHERRVSVQSPSRSAQGFSRCWNGTDSRSP